jgi:WD40 repeat protein
MMMCTYSLDDPNHRKKYKSLSTWVSPGVQMSITYMQKNSILYSGATNGSIYSWRVQERKVKDTLQGHTDMVMSLVTLPKLNYLASASLDKTISIWDTFANQQILKLYGHMKGALSIDYSEEYRLLVSAGFDYEAYIWSPFSNASVYRLKGHHFPLVGCQAVKDTPEIITADSSGVMKLWDIRTFKCVQTISADLTTQESLEDYKLGSFLQCSIPSKGVVADKDSRIYAVAKEFSAFDQTRVVHDATTDESSVLWMDWDKEHMTIITSSERNIMTWDALLGSKTTM